MLLFSLTFIVVVNADVSHLGQHSGYDYPEPHPSFHDELSLPIAPKPTLAPVSFVFSSKEIVFDF